MMFKVTALAVMLLGLVVCSGAAEVPQLGDARALDIDDDGDRALNADDGARALADEKETKYPVNPDGKNKDKVDACFYAHKKLDLGCYKLTPRRDSRGLKYCSVKPLKEEVQDCDQDGYGYEKCTRNVCSPYRGKLYSSTCGTESVEAYEGYVCEDPSYGVGDLLDTCSTPYTCQAGTCAPCEQS